MSLRPPAQLLAGAVISLALALGALSASGSDASQAISSDTDSRVLGGTLRLSNRLLLERLRNADQFAGNGEYDRACRLWQFVLTRNGDTLMTRDDWVRDVGGVPIRTFRPVQVGIEQVLQGLPVVARVTYHCLFDGQARALLTARRARIESTRGRGTVARQFYLTSVGADAAVWLARRSFDRGDLAGASRLLGKVQRHRRRTSLGREGWLTRLAIADARLDDPAAKRWFSELKSLTLTETSITDAGLAHLGGLTNLQNLFLRGTRVTDAGLAHLKSLKNLRQLRLQSTRITAAGMVHLANLTELRLLFIEDTAMTDAGLAHLKNLKRLRHLYMHNTKVTDRGLVHLRGLPELFAVSLDNTSVTDAGLVNFVGLPIFERLYLSGTAITDEGLVHLKSIKTLSDLNLKRTRVTDAGLRHLEGLKQLVRLGLPQQPQGQVTRGAVEKLKKALPGARDVY